MPETRPGRNLLRSAGIVGIVTGASRICGYARDLVLAVFLGAGTGMDAFTVAFRLANLLRRLVGEGAMTAVFVPVFTQLEKKTSPKKLWEFAGLFGTALAFVVGGIVLVNIALAPWIAKVLAPGFGEVPGKWELTIYLSRLMAPYLLFISMAALGMAILNTRHIFALPAFTPILFNLSMIAGALGLAPWFGEPAVGAALGALLGGVLQWLVQLPALHRCGFRFQWRLAMGHPEIRRVGRLMVPGMLGIGITQFQLIFASVVASFLAEGSVSALYFANRLMELTLGIFAVSLATVILPTMSRQVADRKYSQMKQTLVHALRSLSWVTIPATVGLIVLASPIVEVLFQHGRFTAADTQRTAMVLVYFALGLFCIASVRVVVPVFYAFTDMKNPVRIAGLSFLVNGACMLLLFRPMQVSGIALATSLAAGFQLWMLLIVLRRRVGRLGLRSLGMPLAKITLASSAMGVFCPWFLDATDFASCGLAAKVGLLFGDIALGAGLYLLLGRLMGLRGRRHLSKSQGIPDHE